MGASSAVLQMENVRIAKDVRNHVNRQINCDASNIDRIMNAAEAQVRDILYLDEEVGLDKLPKPLREIAPVSYTHLVEYAFPPVGSAENLESIEFSFEACSEAPCYRNDWPSDIYVCVNGVQIGVWHCPGDFGGRRGRNNPDWWSDSNSQFGRLVVWRVSAHGTQLDGQPVSRI